MTFSSRQFHTRYLNYQSLKLLQAYQSINILNMDCCIVLVNCWDNQLPVKIRPQSHLVDRYETSIYIFFYQSITVWMVSSLQQCNTGLSLTQHIKNLPIDMRRSPAILWHPVLCINTLHKGENILESPYLYIQWDQLLVSNSKQDCKTVWKILWLIKSFW